MFKKIVSCEECKCLIYKEDAQVIEVISWILNYTNYYCRTHVKPYSWITISTEGKKKVKYFIRDVECDSNGKVIK